MIKKKYDEEIEKEILRNLAGFVSVGGKNKEISQKNKENYQKMVTLLSQIESGERLYRNDDSEVKNSILALLLTAAKNAKKGNKRPYVFESIPTDGERSYPKFNFYDFSGDETNTCCRGTCCCGTVNTIRDNSGNIFIDIPSVIKALEDITIAKTDENFNENDVRALDENEKEELAKIIQGLNTLYEQIEAAIKEDGDKTRAVVEEKGEDVKAHTTKESDKIRTVVKETGEEVNAHTTKESDKTRTVVKETEEEVNAHTTKVVNVVEENLSIKIDNAVDEVIDKLNNEFIKRDRNQTTNPLIQTSEQLEEQPKVKNGVTENGYEWMLEDGDIIITSYKGSDTELVIPSTINGRPVKIIAEKVFYRNSSIQSLIIPSSVKSIEGPNFSWCDNLTIYCKAQTKPRGWGLGWNDGSRPVVWDCCDNGTTEKGCKWTLLKDGNITIAGCNGNITNLTIPSEIEGKKVTAICSYAFKGCKNLTSVTIPESVTSIGDCAFEGCSLTSITIPEGILSIGKNVFSDCSSLTSITIPSCVTSIERVAFKGCGSLTSVTIPNSVTSIGDGAFAKCENLTEITIPNSVTSIGDYAFISCTNLMKLTIPNGVTSIGEGAFDFCDSLTSITIPNSVTSIGKNAFIYCDKLTIYCEALSKPNGWDNDWNSSNRPVVWNHCG